MGKTLTFTVTDALLSATGFAILSGAGLITQNTGTKVHYHVTTNTTCAATEIDLTDALTPLAQVLKFVILHLFMSLKQKQMVQLQELS